MEGRDLVRVQEFDRFRSGAASGAAHGAAGGRGGRFRDR